MYVHVMSTELYRATVHATKLSTELYRPRHKGPKHSLNQTPQSANLVPRVKWN